MRVFISGGTGNMGQNLTKKLIEGGHEVVLLTRTPDRVKGLIGLPNVTLVKGGVHDYDVIEKALAGCDAVVDFALNMRGKTALEIFDSDTRAVIFLLDAAEKAGVKKFLFTSSVAVMGGEVNEKSPLQPYNIYAATKAAAEAYVLGFSGYFAGFAGEQGKEVTMKRNVIRPGETFSDPAFVGGAILLQQTQTDDCAL